MAALKVSWDQVSTIQYYSARDIHPLLAGALAERGVGVSGISRYRPRPPVMGLDFEIDVRDVPTERLF